jgi:predicted secreted protein
MAVTAGRNGEIKIELPAADLGSPSTVTTSGSLNSAVTATIGSVRSWSLEESVETLDTTVMNTAAAGFIFRDVVPSFKSWTVSVDFLYDPADTYAQFEAHFKAGNTVNIAIYPESDAAGKAVFGGKALLTSISRSASYDGVIECSATFEGRAALIVDSAIS